MAESFAHSHFEHVLKIEHSLGGLETLGRYTRTAILYKQDNFCDLLLIVLYAKRGRGRRILSF